MNRTKKIWAVVIVLILVVGIIIYKQDKTKTYNSLISTANKHMDKGEYDKAIKLFEQSSQYKKDPNVDKNIKRAKDLKEESTKSKKQNSDEKLITKAKADELIKSIEHFKKGSIIKYIGIKNLPSVDYDYIPKEIYGKKVHTFTEVVRGDQVAQYYVDMEGHLYRDTVALDGKCIKIK